MDRYNIQTRSISEALYVKNNPGGDPFKITQPKNFNEAILFGIGIGLYWGEGTKASNSSIRLGNTDPYLIALFIKWLIKFFKIKKTTIKFSLQIFSDINPRVALKFWIKALEVSPKQFLKTIVTKSYKPGTYRKKNQTGVVTIYFHNIKLRRYFTELLDNYKSFG